MKMLLGLTSAQLSGGFTGGLGGAGAPPKPCSADTPFYYVAAVKIFL